MWSGRWRSTGRRSSRLRLPAALAGVRRGCGAGLALDLNIVDEARLAQASRRQHNEVARARAGPTQIHRLSNGEIIGPKTRRLEHLAACSLHARELTIACLQTLRC